MPLTYHNTRTGRTVHVPTPDEAADKSSAPKRARRRQEKLLGKLDESNRWVRVGAGESFPARTPRRDTPPAPRAVREVQRDLDATAERPVQHDRAPAEDSGLPRTPKAEDPPTETAPATPEPVAEPSLADVRAWAETAGIEVSARGRISKDVIDAYKHAHADGGE